LNKKILSLAATFVATTNLSFRQTASPAMHEFMVRLIQLGASLPRDAFNTIVDVDQLIDQITDAQVAEQLRANADGIFRAAL
jgi:hypothetical protein